MPDNSEITSQRKKEHIELCLTDKVSFKEKKNGFDNYEFEHYAITEVDIKKISFHTKFLKKKINYPFLISCMTGGTTEAENINAKLALAANNLNIPIGVGSQRQALENGDYHSSYKIIRMNAPEIPVLGNIGAAQIVQLKSFEKILMLADLVEADAMVIHLNPAQELIQDKGEPEFSGLLKKLEKLVRFLPIPVIAKEVGSGISKKAAKKLLEIGVKGIDVAGAGGTSWTGVEILRNKNDNNSSEFWDWGLPTSYCIRTVNELKRNHNFTLIASGGINSPVDMAKAFSLGADMAASARLILQTLEKSGVEGVQSLVENWFKTLKKIMFLTGSSSLSEFKKNKLLNKEELY